MFLGHYAVGFASKKYAPETSLGLLILAPLWLDVLWPIFILLGVERAKIVPGITKVIPMDLEHYPYSHSLVASVLWATLFALIYFIYSKKKKASLVLWLGVVSHWILDFLTHRPDLPITLNGAERVGLSLWNFPAATFFVEFAMFVGSFALYLKETKAKDSVGKNGVWIYAVFLFVIFCTLFRGVVPPNMQVVAFSSILLFPLIPIAAWLDKRRISRQYRPL